MKLFKKEQITSKRTFSYSKSGVNLSFTLDENNAEMVNFKDLLLKALSDVEEAIERKNK